MQLKHIVWVLCSLSIAALGQSSAQSPTSQPLHGIKVFSSSFDSTTQIAKLDFINDSPSDITAWGYCTKATKANSDDPDQEFCTFRDALGLVIDQHAQEQITLKPSRGVCEDCSFIRPGQHKTITAGFSGSPVANAEIKINVIVHADGTTETSGKFGDHLLQEISADRRTALRIAQLMVTTAEGILADQGNAHPAVSMTNELQRLAKTEPSVGGVLYWFKRPEWRKANRTEFIPEDERSYLRQFVTEYQLKVAGFSKNQVTGKTNEGAVTPVHEGPAPYGTWRTNAGIWIRRRQFLNVAHGGEQQCS